MFFSLVVNKSKKKMSNQKIDKCHCTGYTQCVSCACCPCRCQDIKNRINADLYHSGGIGQCTGPIEKNPSDMCHDYIHDEEMYQNCKIRELLSFISSDKY